MGKSRLAVSTCWQDVDDELDVGIAFLDDLVTDWSINQAKAIYLSVAHGLSQSDLASTISKSQQNVSKTLNSAKEALLVRCLRRFETIINQAARSTHHWRFLSPDRYNMPGKELKWREAPRLSGRS